MKAIIQRVTQAKINVDNTTIGEIQRGLVVLLGVEQNDNPTIAEALAQRIINYRVFSDTEGKMNLNLAQIQGELLVISQFTLVADTSRGRRPSFSSAATPEQANTLYEHFIHHCQQQCITTQSGRFGENMQVSLTNDGPVTFILEAK